MENLKNMDAEQMEQYIAYAMMHDNLQAVREAREFLRYHNKKVIVVKGRKIPHGIKGFVFSVSRVHFGQNQWEGWSTRIGFKDANGLIYWTNANNITIDTDEL